MEVLITDKIEAYTNYSGDKVLIRNSIIEKATLCDEIALQTFNRKLNGIENTIAESVITELKHTANTIGKVKANKFLKTRKIQYDINYSLLYQTFITKILYTRVVEFILHSFLKNIRLSKIEFLVSSDYLFLKQNPANHKLADKVSFHFYEEKKHNLKLLKNLFYFFYSLPMKVLAQTQSKNANRKRFVLYLYDTNHYWDLFTKFFELANNSKTIKLIVVEIESGGKTVANKTEIYKRYINIAFYKFQKFRNVLWNNSSPIYHSLKNTPYYETFLYQDNITNLELYYAFSDLSIKYLKPDIVLYVNTSETGRAISDVARYHNVPSVNIDYAFFTDDYIHMEGNIQFTARACIGQATIDLWKKRNDKSFYYWPVGYLKFDTTPKSFDKNELRKKYNIENSNKTLFFASTWGGTNGLYNIEKVEICKHLEKYAFENNFNFIVKKHPSETDDLIKNNTDRNKTMVLEHNDCNLEEMLFFSDVIINQASGIVLEAMFYKKPILFANLNADTNIAKLSLIKNESFVSFANTLEELDDCIIKMLDADHSTTYDCINNYFFSNTKCLASQKLLDNCLNIVDGNVF
jgi:hypothetical protein